MSADNKKTCFVIFPFNRKYKTRLKNIYQPALESVGLTVEIAGTPGTDKITVEIEKKIRESFICLADITEDNLNVWYEVGYAYGCDKNVVLVCNKKEREFDKLPFDIKDKYVIGYSSVGKNSRVNCQKEIIADAKAKMEKAERESVPGNDIPKEFAVEDMKFLDMIIAHYLTYGYGIFFDELSEHMKLAIINFKRNQYITTEERVLKASDRESKEHLIYIPTEKAIKLKEKYPEFFPLPLSDMRRDEKKKT